MPLDTLVQGHQAWGRTGPSGLRAALAAGTPAPGGADFSSPPPPPAPRKGPTALPSRAQVRCTQRACGHRRPALGALSTTRCLAADACASLLPCRARGAATQGGSASASRCRERLASAARPPRPRCVCVGRTGLHSCRFKPPSRPLAHTTHASAPSTPCCFGNPSFSAPPSARGRGGALSARCRWPSWRTTWT